MILLKWWSGTKIILSIYLFPALLFPLLVIPFTIKQITGFTTASAKDANKAAMNLLSFLFISRFTVSVIPSIINYESCGDFIIAIMPFISSFEMNKFNLFPGFTLPFPVFFLSNWFIEFEAAFEAILFTNPDNLSLAKRIARSIPTFSHNLFNQESRNPLGWIILDILAYCWLKHFLF